jgi:hypothetical protein
MAKKATELSELHIRRLKHIVTASGELRAKRYSVGGAQALIFNALRQAALIRLELNHGY